MREVLVRAVHFFVSRLARPRSKAGERAGPEQRDSKQRSINQFRLAPSLYYAKWRAFRRGQLSRNVMDERSTRGKYDPAVHRKSKPS
jgi:hypothetical protein